MELGETTEQGAMRETVEEAGARIELQGLFTLLNVVRVGQVHLFYRARLLDTDFAPGPETIEAEAVCRTRDSLGRARLPHRAGNPERFFADKRNRVNSACTAPISLSGLIPGHRTPASHIQQRSHSCREPSGRSRRPTTRLREDLIHPDPLLDCLVEVCRLHGQAASRASLSAGLPLVKDGRADARPRRARGRARRHVGQAAAPAARRDRQRRAAGHADPEGQPRLRADGLG
jgi:hypothetical protein